MKTKKRKIFPKIKKKLKGFLTDESGKITKKGALGIAAGATLLAGVNEVEASCAHTNDVSHGNAGSCTSIHGSGIVNGHYSISPGATHNNGGGCEHSNACTHVSHGSHGSHGQW